MNYRRQEVTGVLLCVLALFISISLGTYDPTEDPSGFPLGTRPNNMMGHFGMYTSFFLMFYTFGWGTFFFPIILGLFGYYLFTHKNIKKLFWVSAYITSLGIWVSLFIGFYGLLADTWWKAVYSGVIGFTIVSFFSYIFGPFSLFAVSLLLIMALILIISGLLDFSIFDCSRSTWEKIKDYWREWKERRRLDKVIVRFDEYSTHTIDEVPDESSLDALVTSEPDSDPPKPDVMREVAEPIPDIESDNESLDDEFLIDDVAKEEITIEEEKAVEEGDLDADKERRARYLQYKLPTLEYLHDPIEISNPQSEEDLKEKANQLIHALETFGVFGRVVRISPGPVITLFAIEPAEGVRVNKFTNLADDLARVMKAQRVRIIAPIPGSRSVGVELPNDNPATVYIKNIINSEQFIQSKSKLSISLGKTTTGEAYVFDLSKMPHILVAGATGAGKSVCINTMIVSILYKAKPDEVKFILMDPKKLELATYKSLVGYHLITAPNLNEYVMTTAENAVGILDSAIVEMERRFQIFADARVRNISEYHARRVDDPDLESIPFVVVVIDELADLMLTSGRAIEEPITRIAQKARAVGMHLVVATQRPSVDIITGLIKSNFPARIAFQVSSQVDSRTIIDQKGAEKLLGNGDMLFLLPGTASPIRLHNAFITLDEIQAIMEHIEGQPKPEELTLPETRKEKIAGDFSLDKGQDELLHDAAVLVTQNQQASVSLLQRKFRIGYSRAGRLIDELESLGIVSGYSGSKAREVLVDQSYLDNIFNE